MGKKKNIYRLLIVKLQEKVCLENLGVKEWVMLK